MNQRVCFYHGSDLDGKCSAAIVARVFGAGHVELIPLDYGRPMPWEKVNEDTEVIMVDFGLQPFSQMLELNQRAKSFTWIDHHSSAIDDYNSQDERWTTLLCTDRAACELTWEFFHEGQPVPSAVRMLGLYDTWKWQGKRDVLEFQYGMRSIENNPHGAIWDAILNPIELDQTADSLIRAGTHIVRYNNKQLAGRARATAFPLKWQNLRFIAANSQGKGSALLDNVFDPEQHDAMLSFGYRKGFWHIGLFAPPELCEQRGMHMGNLAKRFGGGGHAGAAGFQARQLPFDLPLEEA
jgi:hypothetical protein